MTVSAARSQLKPDPDSIPNRTLNRTLAGAVEEGGEPAAGRPARLWGDISFVLPLVLTTAGGLFGIAAGMTVLPRPLFGRSITITAASRFHIALSARGRSQPQHIF